MNFPFVAWNNRQSFYLTNKDSPNMNSNRTVIILKSPDLLIYERLMLLLSQTWNHSRDRAKKKRFPFRKWSDQKENTISLIKYCIVFFQFHIRQRRDSTSSLFDSGFQREFLRNILMFTTWNDFSQFIGTFGTFGNIFRFLFNFILPSFNYQEISVLNIFILTVCIYVDISFRKLSRSTSIVIILLQ